MKEKLVRELEEITEEEQAILQGRAGIDRSLYYTGGGDYIDASKVLENGKVIDIRKHVRFVHFPAHTHNFVEFIYMCQGTTTHIIDGDKLTLQTGDLLFLNQHATQEILPAGKEDIAVNFMILPQFLNTAFHMLGDEKSALRDFLISCLTERDIGGNYLYFHVSDIAPIQNLMENLLVIMLSPGQKMRRTLSENTMGLLFLHLVDTADRIDAPSYEENLVLRLLNSIETSYRTITLGGFCEKNKTDLYYMERLIARRTGKTFRSLLQEKRLSQACYLLRNTTLSVSDIALAAGYSNNSFFHRLFRREMGTSPKEYREQGR